MDVRGVLQTLKRSLNSEIGEKYIPKHLGGLQSTLHQNVGLDLCFENDTCDYINFHDIRNRPSSNFHMISEHKTVEFLEYAKPHICNVVKNISIS